MKFLIPIFLFLAVVSCKNKQASVQEDEIVHMKPEADSTGNKEYFPVTAYIRGQLAELRQDGLNPLKYVTTGTHKDSSWVKIENLEKEMQEFLTPVIDTANVSHLFKEARFNDQTINAITFSYDPLSRLPDSFTIRHWDVYIDPARNTVRRIYLVKRLPDKESQLTWQSGKWCKITELDIKDNMPHEIIKETFYNWDF